MPSEAEANLEPFSSSVWPGGGSGHCGIQVVCGGGEQVDGFALVTAGGDEVVRLWDLDRLQPAGELHGHTDGVRTATTWTRADGATLLTTAGDDQSVLTWLFVSPNESSRVTNGAPGH